MLNWKNNLRLTAIAIAFLYSSCMEHKVLFSFNDNVNTQFFKNIPGIGSSTFLKDTVVGKANSIQVYKSSFRERYVEKNHLLDITELNDSTELPFVHYWRMHGYSQDMYLLKYQFKVRPKTKPDARIQTRDAMLFFSVKFDKEGACIGFGPSYFGIIEYSRGYIAFPTELSTKNIKSEFYLNPVKQIKISGGYLFFPLKLSRDESINDLSIQKIVKLDTNKIGSYKPLVFDVPEIFQDSNALHFHYDTIINLIH